MCITLLGYSLLIEKRETPFNDYMLTVSIKVDSKEITIYPYQKFDEYYFFLPPYARNENTTLNKNKKNDILIDDTKLSSKTKITDLKENYRYNLTNNNEAVGTLTIMFGSDLPTLFIETESKENEFLTTNKDLEEPASLMIINNEKIEYLNSINHISGRGHFSWTLEKKGFGLKLLEESPILGMNSSDEWILTSNMFDDSMGLRNYVAYSMAKEIGMNDTSDFKFVDLYLNKAYQGTYLLFERIGQSENKLDIGDLDLLNNKANKTIELERLKLVQENNINPEYPDRSYREFNSPGDISGGYIIERNVLTKTRGKEHLFTTSNNETFVVRYPNYVNKEELEYIEGVVEAVDRALHNDNYIDPITNKKLEELIDIDSFVLKYLVDEVTKNEGAGSTSCYYYKKQGDDLLYAGPVWDYDKSLGRYAEWANPEGIANAMLYRYDDPTDWYDRLYNNKEAYNLIKKYYKERVKPFLDKVCTETLDEQANIIRDSYKMNDTMWGYNFFFDEYYLPGHLIEHVGDLDYSVNYLKNWIKLREEFLDKEWGIEDEH